MLLDKFNRAINLVELEVNESCQFECGFCPHGKDVRPSEPLETEHIIQFISVMTRLGLERVRLRGGEPLLRPDILDLVEELANLPQLKRLSMTTNGLLLAGKAGNLAEAGLSTLVLTLPSLDHDIYTRVTGSDQLSEVMNGIDATLDHGPPLSIRVPIMAGVNESGVEDILDFAISVGAPVSFYQVTSQAPDAFISTEGLLHTLGRNRSLIESSGEKEDEYLVEGSDVEVQVAMFDRKTCGQCNRFWVSYNGVISLCSGLKRSFDLKSFMEDEPSENELVDMASKICLNKPLTDTASCVEKTGGVWF